MSEVSLTLEAAIEQAAKRGLVVVLPKDNELFVDLDTPHDFACYVRYLAKLKENLPGLVVAEEVHASASGLPHRHATVTLSRPVKSNEERIMLQALLGSDGMRELLSWLRVVLAVREQPTVFFEKPKESTP